MNRQERDKSPWTPSAYFTNGAVLLVIGVLLISADAIPVVGYALAIAGGVMILIGAINKGTSHNGGNQSD